MTWHRYGFSGSHCTVMYSTRFNSIKQSATSTTTTIKNIRCNTTGIAKTARQPTLVKHSQHMSQVGTATICTATPHASTSEHTGNSDRS